MLLGFSVQPVSDPSLAVGRVKANARRKRFRRARLKFSYRRSDAFYREIANRNAAFQSYPVHTGPGSKPEHFHVKPKNRNMEETFNERVFITSSLLATGTKSQIYYVDHKLKWYR
jgi:hypothetical protein